MSGKILKFIIDNINRLQLFDYVFIFMISAFMGFGLFCIFRWLYGARFKAQSDLIEIKDKIIASYEQTIERLSRERKKTKRERRASS